MGQNTNKPPALPLPGQRLGPSGLVGRFMIKNASSEHSQIKKDICQKNDTVFSDMWNYVAMLICAKHTLHFYFKYLGSAT